MASLHKVVHCVDFFDESIIFSVFKRVCTCCSPAVWLLLLGYLRFSGDVLLKQAPWLCFSGARQLQWVFSQARVALALVLVKIRPSSMSPREYAETLASRLKSLDVCWKEEALELQREVLRLRQELLMSRVAATLASSSEAAGGNADRK